jgi:hypothetical protein
MEVQGAVPDSQRRHADGRGLVFVDDMDGTLATHCCCHWHDVADLADEKDDSEGRGIRRAVMSIELKY